MQDSTSKRKSFSVRQIKDIERRINTILTNQNSNTELCLYLTGSYAREEASEFSDLDLFFLTGGKEEMPRIEKTLIDAEIIKMQKELCLPEFSGDGIYLVHHSVDDLITTLGNSQDDYKNRFTARMLLLLESKSLYGSPLYNAAIKTVVDTYYSDYHDHEVNFRPVFLANDIIRFWKTMCLNYENKRTARPENRKAKSYLKNLKLKFARLNTCFSFLSCLDPTIPLDQKDLIAISKLTPAQRLDKLAKDKGQVVEKCTKKIKDFYEYFLYITDDNDTKVLEWIGEKKNRDEAFGKAREFHSAYYDLLCNACPSLLKYYTI